jgi:hypothetical protein
MRDEQADQIVQHLTKIEEVLQTIAVALGRMAPPEKRRRQGFHHKRGSILGRIGTAAHMTKVLGDIVNDVNKYMKMKQLSRYAGLTANASETSLIDRG